MYLIDNQVYFNYASGKLFDLHNECYLGEHAKECLTLLLEKSDIIVTKEEIMQRVWRSKGIVVSDNAVRQTMHIIRKTFSRFPLNRQIIITIPRNGYMIINAIEVSDNDDSLIKNQSRSTETSWTTLNPKLLSLLKALWPGYKGLAFSLVLSAVACISYTHFVGQTSEQPKNIDINYKFTDRNEQMDPSDNNREQLVKEADNITTLYNPTSGK